MSSFAPLSSSEISKIGKPKTRRYVSLSGWWVRLVFITSHKLSTKSKILSVLRPYPHSKWIYSACMSWSEKGQLTSQRKQTTARDKLNLTTHLTLHLCELSHIKMDFVFEYAASPTYTLYLSAIHLYLWDALTLYLRLTVLCVTYQDGNKFGKIILLPAE